MITAAARSVAPLAEAGYAVFVDGVVLPWALDVYREALAERGISPLAFVLLPDLEETLRRGMARMTPDQLDESAYRQMHAEFVTAFATRDGATVIEAGTVDEIVQEILVASEQRNGA